MALCRRGDGETATSGQASWASAKLTSGRLRSGEPYAGALLASSVGANAGLCVDAHRGSGRGGDDAAEAASRCDGGETAPRRALNTADSMSSADGSLFNLPSKGAWDWL